MKLTVLKIEKTIDKENVVLYPTLIQNAGRTYLVDCGYDETPDEFENEIKKLGITITDLKGVIVTHDDHDHLGGLRYLKQKNQNLEIYCGEHEKDSVSGLIKSERLIQAESSLACIPEEFKSWAQNFIRKLKNVRRFNVDKVFKDNDTFEDTIKIIHTPGHTKGHIALFCTEEETLIAGDSLVIENGKFNIANPSYTLHMEQAIESVEKIRKLNPRKIICYHGGVMETNIGENLQMLIDKYKSNPTSTQND